ncbi:hypothetical protein A6D98_06035 [Aliivibrio fischeri]|uniref:DUF4760 domain-containing protein n=1 Tax=Aliivibrio fischeri TaxID=668 RepID=UPI00080E1516|nr:DUF4760 domain-containing protein [Aliivibrio fischeri]OCH05899.1 hypothetical protein A6E10_07485 [Aliivibrio fischeri]OCH27465.1 hypothetical protein A6E13_06880 [Aliivibrio fischeri]OCH62558.1 hypothetical protein A6D98_06035 [Aliivibrio fischeri]
MWDSISQILLCLWDKNPMIYASAIATGVAYTAIKTNQKQARIKNSIDFESTLKHDKTALEAARKSADLFREHKADCNGCQFISNLGTPTGVATKEARYLSDFLNEWERCANGIFHNVYDEDLLYGTYAGTVLMVFNRSKPFIVARQSSNSQSKRIYIKLCWLALRWQIRKAKETGEEIDPIIYKTYKLYNKHHTNVYKKTILQKLLSRLDFITQKLWHPLEHDHLLVQANHLIAINMKCS